jgi:hypothetical protein
MRFLQKLIIGLFLLISVVSCKKETTWDVDLAIPLAKSYLNISNFFGDTIFQADPNGLLHIAFSKDLINYTMDSLVNLPDTTVTLGYTLPFSQALSAGVVIYSNAASTTDREIKFDVSNGVELNKAIVRSGYLKVDYSNTYNQPLDFNYIINSASLWGNLLTINQTVAGNSSFTKTYPLNGYNINLTGQSGNKVNTLVQTYTISTSPSGVASTLQPGQGLIIKLSFVDIVPEYVQGYFGQQDLSFGPDSTSLGFLGNFSPSNLMLTQSAINFRIINEFGVEMSSSINSMKSIKTSPANVVTLNAGNLLQSINVNRANKTNNPSNPVFPWLKQINVNSSNSNLNPFLQNLPNYLGYSIKATLNPLGNISAGNDFAFYGRGLIVIADVDIPLALSANYFSLVNFSKVDLTQLKELNDVNSCDIIMQTRNNYPFRAQIQGYMLNDQNQIIDSLFVPGQNIIESAITDGNNVVLNYVDSKLIASFDKTKITNLTQCKQIKFVSYLYLPNQPTPIKINEDSYLDLVVHAYLNYNVRAK